MLIRSTLAVLHAMGTKSTSFSPAFSWTGSALLLVALPAAAQQTASSAAPASIGSGLLQLVLGFIAVIALIFASLWLLKRLTTPQGRNGGLMKVVTALPIGPRERVVLLEIGDRWLLVGVGPGHITALGETPRQELPPPSSGPTPTDFSAWFKRAMERRAEPRQ